jgi:hypothetical protein
MKVPVPRNLFERRIGILWMRAAVQRPLLARTRPTGTSPSNVRFRGQDRTRYARFEFFAFLTHLRHVRLKTFAAQKHCSFLR